MDERDAEIALIGGGGHAAVVAEAAIAAGLRVRGFHDDDPEASVLSLAHLGAIGAASGGLHLAVGDLALRRRLLERLDAGATVVHPASLVSSSATVGAGTFIGAGVIVQARARIGACSIINTGAIVEHDVEIGVNAHIAPGVVLGGDVRIGADVLVGLGARVRPGVSIGDGAVVGVGAAVVKDVPRGQVVVGVPARSSG